MACNSPRVSAWLYHVGQHPHLQPSVVRKKAMSFRAGRVRHFMIWSACLVCNSTRHVWLLWSGPPAGIMVGYSPCANDITRVTHRSLLERYRRHTIRWLFHRFTAWAHLLGCRKGRGVIAPMTLCRCIPGNDVGRAKVIQCHSWSGIIWFGEGWSLGEVVWYDAQSLPPTASHTRCEANPILDL